MLLSFRSHLWICFSAKGWWKLHITPLSLADVICGGINLGSHVEDIHSILGNDWLKEYKLCYPLI